LRADERINETFFYEAMKREFYFVQARRNNESWNRMNDRVLRG